MASDSGSPPERRTRDIFLGDVNEELICGLCTHVLTWPVSVSCALQHCVCKRCADDLFGGCAVSKCPACGKQVEREQVISMPYVQRQIDRLPSRCPNVALGCGWSGPFSERAGHGTACEFLASACRGCGMLLRRADLPAHEEACGSLPRPCAFADLGCRELLLARERDAHERECRARCAERYNAAVAARAAAEESAAAAERAAAEAAARVAAAEAELEAAAARESAATAGPIAHASSSSSSSSSGSGSGAGSGSGLGSGSGVCARHPEILISQKNSGAFLSFVVSVKGFAKLADQIRGGKVEEWASAPSDCSVPSIPWELALCPDRAPGARSDPDAPLTHLGVYLRQRSQIRTASAPKSARFAMSLLNEDKARTLTFEATDKPVSLAEEGRGWPFAPLSELSARGAGGYADASGTARFLVAVWPSRRIAPAAELQPQALLPVSPQRAASLPPKAASATSTPARRVLPLPISGIKREREEGGEEGAPEPATPPHPTPQRARQEPAPESPPPMTPQPRPAEPEGPPAPAGLPASGNAPDAGGAVAAAIAAAAVPATPAGPPVRDPPSPPPGHGWFVPSKPASRSRT
eukprot:tig00000828_g4636.t1